MDELKNTVTALTGAINRFMEQIKSVEGRLTNIETTLHDDALGRVMSRLVQLEGTLLDTVRPVETISRPLQRPQTVDDLKDISRLPDSVKELRVFDGNPTQYISWVHSVESILKDFDIVREKPIYRAIVQSIRQKVVGAADTALVSYNVFDSSWDEIKKVLSLHYADKRDIQTLEHQLNQLSQGSSPVEEFYATVNHQLSLIVNKLKTESYGAETVKALVETYRNRSLDIFIRGLKPDLSRMIIIQKPKTLPEAYSACLELQNLTMRNNILYAKTSSWKTNSIPADMVNRPSPSRPPKPMAMRSSNKWQRDFRPRNFNYDRNLSHERANGHGSNSRPALPPRYPVTKYEPMDVDRTVQSRQVNYMNNPVMAVKRSSSEPYSNGKQPRLYNIETSTDDIVANEVSAGRTNSEEPSGEVNFMKEGHLAYLT